MNKKPKIKLILFYILLIFVRLPPVYLLPFNNPFFTSHSVARYLIIFIFVLIAIEFYLRDTKVSIPKIPILLILVYFFTQSLSIIKVLHVGSFLLDYKDLVFSILLFYITLILVNRYNINKIVWILIITSFINLVYEYTFYLFPEIIYIFLQPFFYDKYWESLNYQFQRQRFFPEIFDESFIPLLFYVLYSYKNLINTTLIILFISGMTIFSLISNWRVRLVIFVFSLLLSLKVYAKKSKKYAIIIFASVILSLIFGYIISIKVIGFNSLDRLMFPNKQDITNITSRFKYFNETTYLALYSPIIGVGIGQYEDYISAISLIPFQNINQKSIRNLEIAYYPHNVFFSTLATSGILGLLSFTLLIFYFLKSDLTHFRKGTLLFNSFIIAFWSLFLLSNSTPTNYFSYQAMFWLIRAIIEKFNPNNTT